MRTLSQKIYFIYGPISATCMLTSIVFIIFYYQEPLNFFKHFFSLSSLIMMILFIIIAFIVGYVVGMLPAMISGEFFYRFIRKSSEKLDLVHYLFAGLKAAWLWVAIALIFFMIYPDEWKFQLTCAIVVTLSSMICAGLIWRITTKTELVRPLK